MSNVKSDIVLSKDEKKECVIELKKATLAKGRDQLFSYLNQIRTISIGVLACKNLHIYYYDFTSIDPNDARPNIEIPFKKNNPDGEKFVELFNYDSFNREYVKKWIISRYEEIRNARLKEENSKKNIETICGDLSNQLVLNLLKQHFVNKGFSENDITAALNKMLISIERQSPVPPMDDPATNNSTDTKLNYYVNNKPVSSKEFETKLIEKKRAKREYHYQSGEMKKDVWDASNFEKNLSGNVHSANYWRTRKQKGLIKVDFLIDD